jgi:hypothetical protein
MQIASAAGCALYEGTPASAAGYRLLLREPESWHHAIEQIDKVEIGEAGAISQGPQTIPHSSVYLKSEIIAVVGFARSCSGSNSTPAWPAAQARRRRERLSSSRDGPSA